MRTYFIDDQKVFVCVIENKNFSGSISFNLLTGEILGNKPENFSNLEWLYNVRHFLKIASMMFAPIKGAFVEPND